MAASWERALQWQNKKYTMTRPTCTPPSTASCSLLAVETGVCAQCRGWQTAGCPPSFTLHPPPQSAPHIDPSDNSAPAVQTGVCARCHGWRTARLPVQSGERRQRPPPPCVSRGCSKPMLPEAALAHDTAVPDACTGGGGGEAMCMGWGDRGKRWTNDQQEKRRQGVACAMAPAAARLKVGQDGMRI